MKQAGNICFQADLFLLDRHTLFCIKEAEKAVKEVGLEISIQNDSEELDKENTIITEQSPREGISVNKNSKIFVKY